MVAAMNTVDSHIQALEMTDAVERRYAETELMRLGRTALVALVDALASATLRQQVVILKLLGKMGDTAALPTLKHALLDPQWLIRQAAVNALANFQADSVLPMIFHALYDHALLVRLEAIMALGRLRHASAVPTLLTHLNSTESDVETYTIVEALGLCGDRSVAATLEPYMYHENAQVRQRTLEALSRLTGTTR
ncbi:MAG: HEAT repeat domain-containing protein [Chloroflexi bacterium]|nr:HEAT repeat domain-containing protein [Chloroflexota bacterium]